jgi:hypothetical protein
MNRRAWIIGALLAVQPTLSHAELFILVDGVQGDVKQGNYAGWHTVQTFTWSYDRSNSTKPFSLNLTFEQQVASIASIKQMALSGAPLKRIIVDNAQHFSTTLITPIARLTCDEAAIRTFATFSDQTHAPKISLEIGCTKLTWEDFEYQSTGTLLKSAKGTWNLRTNTP